MCAVVLRSSLAWLLGPFCSAQEAITNGTIKDTNVNVPFSQFATRNVPVLCSEEARVKKALVAPVVDHKYYIQQKGWVHKHMVSNSTSSAAAAIMRDSVVRLVLAGISSALGKEYTSRLEAAEGEPWLNGIFQPQLMTWMPGFVNIGITPFALPEARVVLEGVIFVAALPCEALTSENYAQKIEELGQLTFEAFSKLVSERGTCALLRPGATFVVPAGFICVEVTTEIEGDIAVEQCGSSLRWSFMADSDSLRSVVHAHLTQMLDAWPSLAQGDVGNLAKRLGLTT